MRLQVTVRHGNVSDRVRNYVEAKFRKLEKRLHDATEIQVVLDRERNPKIADDHVVEATIYAKGPTLHGREAAATYEAAADLLIDKVERQVERYRDKRVHERRRRSAGSDEVTEAPAPDETAPEESAA